MAYTEIKQRNNNKYYYRVISVRKGSKISKIRKYLGVNLSKTLLILKEKKANNEFKIIYRNKELENIKKKIINVLIRNNIKKAGIFGSYAVGEARKNSDIDILIEPAKGMGFGFAGLEIQLKKALKRKVDLVSYNGLSPHLRDKILSQEIKIL